MLCRRVKKTTCDVVIRIQEYLWLVRFHFASECIGDEVDHVLPRDHAGPWLGTWPSCEISSKGAVVFTGKEKQHPLAAMLGTSPLTDPRDPLCRSALEGA